MAKVSSMALMKSKFPRVPGDFYPTIDERCVYALLEHYLAVKETTIIDPCAPQGSGIVDTLRKCGYSFAIGEVEAFADGLLADWLVTNPPYTRPLVDQIIERQLKRLEDGEIRGMAFLMRSGFDFTKDRFKFFRDCPYYEARIQMTFRPWWSESHEKQPFHTFVWHVWTKAKKVYAPTAPPFLLYSEGKSPAE